MAQAQTITFDDSTAVPTSPVSVAPVLPAASRPAPKPAAASTGVMFDDSTAVPTTPSTPTDNTTAPTESNPIHDLAHSFMNVWGATKKQLTDDAAERKAHPVKTALTGLLGPGWPMVSGAIQGGLRSLGELSNIPGNLGVTASPAPGFDPSKVNPWRAAEHAVRAVPFVGKWAGEEADKMAPYNGWTEGLGNTLTNPGAWGTSLGVASQVAPMLMGEGTSRFTRPMPDTITGGMKRVGGAMLDSIVKPDKPYFSRGARPGAAYLEGGGAPALTTGGLASNAAKVVAKTGARLGSLYKGSTESGMRFPIDQVNQTLEEPLARFEAEQSGPGSTGTAQPTIDAYRENLAPQPNPMAIGSDGYTPQGLFDLKRSIAGQAKWNPLEPTGLNEVRQDQVGGIGGMLTDQIPEAGPLNKIYQGALRFGNRAAERARTTSPFSTVSLTRRGLEIGLGELGRRFGGTDAGYAPLAWDAINSVPVKSTAGWGLYNAGKLLGTDIPFTPLGPLSPEGGWTGPVSGPLKFDPTGLFGGIGEQVADPKSPIQGGTAAGETDTNPVGIVFDSGPGETGFGPGKPLTAPVGVDPYTTNMPAVQPTSPLGLNKTIPTVPPTLVDAAKFWNEYYGKKPSSVVMRPGSGEPPVVSSVTGKPVGEKLTPKPKPKAKPPEEK